MFRTFSLVLIALSTTACFGPKSINPSDFRRVALDANSNPPSIEQMNRSRTRVIVFPTEDKAADAQRLKLGEASTGSIEGFVSESAELIDRTLAEKLTDEIKLAEVKGSGAWGGPDVADYAVLSDITLAKASSKFTAGYTYRDKKGNKHVVPPKCSYSAEVEGNLKVHKMPSLVVSKALTLSGRASESEEVRSNYWYRPNQRCDDSNSRMSGLLQQAASNAIKSQRTELQNVFAPKGYITEKRSGDDGSIFKISLGSNNGAQKGLLVNIHREETVTNQLTQQLENEIIPLGSGEITDQVEEKYSWIYIKDEEVADKILLGDIVTIEYKTSIFEDMGNIKNQFF